VKLLDKKNKAGRPSVVLLVVPARAFRNKSVSYCDPEGISKWIRKIATVAKDIPIIMVRSKVDMEEEPAPDSSLCFTEEQGKKVSVAT